MRKLGRRKGCITYRPEALRARRELQSKEAVACAERTWAWASAFTEVGAAPSVQALSSWVDLDAESRNLKRRNREEQVAQMVSYLE